MKNAFDKLVMICDKIVVTSRTVSIDFIDKIDYCFSGTTLSVIMCLLLLIIIAIEYYYYYNCKKDRSK